MIFSGYFFIFAFLKFKPLPMSLQAEIMDAIKAAMKSKDTVSLEALRAVKSALLLAQTESGAKEELSEEDEIKLLQKLVKQRKDSAAIYIEQGRQDLADPEIEQAAVIEKFLPAQLSEAEVEAAVNKIIAENGFSGMADMGKVMGMASKELAGRADGKTISIAVKKSLTN
tara:strand:+ start:103023 stop:103532 length:510 start_codon:yes stop_codon:yes gene_type:complete